MGFRCPMDGCSATPAGLSEWTRGSLPLHLVREHDMSVDDAYFELGEPRPLNTLMEGHTMDGSTIKAAREEAGMTQKELAEAVGVSPGSVAGWETGRYSPRADRQGKLREVLDLDDADSEDAIPLEDAPENASRAETESNTEPEEAADPEDRADTDADLRLEEDSDAAGERSEKPAEEPGDAQEDETPCCSYCGEEAAHATVLCDECHDTREERDKLRQIYQLQGKLDLLRDINNRLAENALQHFLAGNDHLAKSLRYLYTEHVERENNIRKRLENMNDELTAE